MACRIIRRKLVIFGKMTFGGGPTKITGQEWRDEKCGAPVFEKGQDMVCASCLKGWTHENNFMIDCEQNEALLNQAWAATSKTV